MATFPQRAASIFEGVFDGPGTTAQRAGLVALYVPNLPPEWTQAQQAEAFVRAFVRHHRQWHESTIATPGVQAAKQQAASQASVDFPEP